MPARVHVRGIVHHRLESDLGTRGAERDTIVPAQADAEGGDRAPLGAPTHREGVPIVVRCRQRDPNATPLGLEL